MWVAGWIGGSPGISWDCLHLGVREGIPRIIQGCQSNVRFSNR